MTHTLQPQQNLVFQDDFNREEGSLGSPENNPEKIDVWGIVEIFGHTRLAGRLREENRLGSIMLRVDVPDANGETLYTRWFGHAAIFSISPTSREVAIRIAQNCQSAAPVKSWEIQELHAPPTRAIPLGEFDEHPEDHLE